MAGKIQLDGREYDASLLSPEGLKTLAAYQHANAQLGEAVNMRALLTRAKNSYIAELKNEMLQGKTGVDLSALFDDE